MVLRYAKVAIPMSDTRAANALRVLTMLHKKLRANERRVELARTMPSAAEVAHKAKISKPNPIKPNKNDKE